MRLATLLVFLGLLMPASRQDPSMPREPLTVRSLKELGGFTVTLDGTPQASFPSALPCVYFEWAAGLKQGPDWSDRYATSHSDQPLTIVTPRGRLEARHSQVRLYLPVARSRDYTQRDAPNAPEGVGELLSQHERFTVEEFVLEAGHTYHAQVDVESYFLPPGRGSAEPRRQQNFVLAVSDLPFVNGKPQRPLTPTFIGITY